MEMLSAFSTTLHVPNLSSPDHLLSVLEEMDLFNKKEIVHLHAKLQGKRYVYSEQFNNINFYLNV